MAAFSKVLQTVLPFFDGRDKGVPEKKARKKTSKKAIFTGSTRKVETVEIPWRETTIEVTYKRIKNLSVRIVPPQGCIRVSAPWGLSLKKVQQFIDEREQWIQKHLEALRSLVSTTDYQYVDGEVHYFLGKPYVLKVLKGSEVQKATISLHENQLLLKIPNSRRQNEWSLPQKEKMLDKWYREQLYEKASVYMGQYESILGVKAHELRIKKMKTRWGTCNPKDKRVWLNLELIYRPPQCLEYVVLHELCHFIEASHNHKFKALLNTYMPNWKVYEKELDTIPIGCVPK
jgi:predicted metal-dependent hydrolase